MCLLFQVCGNALRGRPKWRRPPGDGRRKRLCGAVRTPTTALEFTRIPFGSQLGASAASAPDGCILEFQSYSFKQLRGGGHCGSIWQHNVANWKQVKRRAESTGYGWVVGGRIRGAAITRHFLLCAKFNFTTKGYGLKLILSH